MLSDKVKLCTSKRFTLPASFIIFLSSLFNPCIAFSLELRNMADYTFIDEADTAKPHFNESISTSHNPPIESNPLRQSNDSLYRMIILIPLALVLGVLAGQYLAGRRSKRKRKDQSMPGQLEFKWEHESALGMMRLINESRDISDLLNRAVSLMRAGTGADAVAVRLVNGSVSQFQQREGFSDKFIESASERCALSTEGHNNESLCALVTKRKLPFEKGMVTSKGSLWVADLMTGDESHPMFQREVKECTVCREAGYASVALFPLNDGERNLGLVQINCVRAGAISEDLVLYWERLIGYLAIAVSKFKVEEELIWSKERNSILSDAATVLLVASDYRRAIRAVCHEVMAFMKCRGYAIFLRPKADLPCQLSVYTGITPQTAENLERAAQEAGGDIAELKKFQCRLLRSEGGRAFCCYLLRSDEDILGTIAFWADDRESFSDNEYSMMRIIGDMVTVAVQRDRADEHERSAKEEWERTFNSVPDLIAILGDDHKLKKVNLAMAQRLGMSPDQCVGQPCFKLIHGMDSPPAICPHAKTIKDGNHHCAEFYSQNLKGDFLVTTTPSLDSAGRMNGTVHVARDISEQKRREEALHKLNRSLLALRNSGLVMVRASSEAEYLKEVCRIVTADCGYAMAWIGFLENAETQTIQPAVMAGLNGTGDRPQAAAEDSSVINLALKVIRSGLPDVVKIQLGSIPFTVCALPIGSTGIMCVYSATSTDFGDDDMALLTDLLSDLACGIDSIRLKIAKAEADNRIRLSEESYRQLVEMSPEPVVVIRKERVAFLNPAALRLLDAQFPEDLLGRPLDELFQADCRDAVKKACGLNKSGKTVRLADVRVKGMEGLEKPTELYLSFYVDSDGPAVQVMIHDVTERKEVEKILQRDKETFKRLVNERTAELMAVQVELERARRLSDIGTLAATVAHELRNPLAAINMAMENIKRKAKNPDLDKHLLNIAHKVAESDQIINNLLFYSRLKPPQFEKVNLAAILEECIESLKNYVKKQMTVERSFDSLRTLEVDADPLQMKEVFINILNNACDAIPDQDGVICIEGKVQDGSVFVSIKDNGEGMSNSDLERVFDPFFTTKSKGTGLGLSVCQQIITFHSGSIEMVSSFSTGTHVNVRLPVFHRPQDGFLFA